MEMTKYQQSASVTAHIKHDLRDLPDGKSSGNEDIVPELTGKNYSLIDRGNSCREVNDYRKELEKEIFSYKRKNVVHAVEWSVQLPDDCPKEQEDAFFQEVHNYLVSTLPMLERCVIVSEVHKDERHYADDGTLLSKDHLHFMYVPAVPDTKHEGYEWKLCADQLTKRGQLQKMHPGLQKHLDECGIHATVYQQKDTGGKSISLSVDQMKDLTAKTGIKLDRNHQLTVDEITKIIDANVLKEKQISALEKQLEDKKHEVSSLRAELTDKDQEIQSVRERTSSAADQRVSSTREALQEKDDALARAARENAVLRQKYADLEAAYDKQSQELEENKKRTADLEARTAELEEKASTKSEEREWGTSSGWGSTKGTDITEDKTW